MTSSPLLCFERGGSNLAACCRPRMSFLHCFYVLNKKTSPFLQQKCETRGPRRLREPLPDGNIGCIGELLEFPVNSRPWLQREEWACVGGRQEPRQEVCIGAPGSEPRRSQSPLGCSSIPECWKPESLFLQHAWNTSVLAKSFC